MATGDVEDPGEGSDAAEADPINKGTTAANHDPSSKRRNHSNINRKCSSRQEPTKKFDSTFYSKTWGSLTDEQWVRSVVTEGYKIHFLSRPPVASPRLFTSRVAKDEGKAIEREVMALLHKKAIEDSSYPGFTSRLFTIPKVTGNLHSVP